jgi:Arc/MetJ-type ribon-helix-helix transcriptional regulator
MTVTLSPDLQARIDEKVRNGEFETVDAVVARALTLFLDEADDEMDEPEFRETTAAIDEALGQADRGEGLPLAEFDRQMRARHGLPR